MSALPAFDPATGEVIDTPAGLPTADGLAARERVSEMADGLLSLVRTAAKLEDELRAVRLLAEEARHQIAEELQSHRTLLDEEDSMAGQTWFLRYLPPRRDGNRSVDRNAVSAHVESLPPTLRPHDVQKVVTKWPTIAELEKHEGELLAAGLSLDELIVEPGWTSPSVEIIERSAAG